MSGRRVTLVAAAAGLALGAACILGVRGFSEFDRIETADGVESLIIDLPASGVRVVGSTDKSPGSVRWIGRWWSTGPNASEAQRNADQAAWDWELSGSVARLSARIPLAVEGVIEVEVDRVSLPDDIDVTISTEEGHVVADDLRGHLVAFVERGDVIVDGLGSVSVIANEGEVRVTTDSHVDVIADDGPVTVEIGSVADVVISAGRGSVTVEVAEDDDLDVVITAGGRIEVSTATIEHVGQGSYRRAQGTADVRLWVDAPEGDVTVEQAQPQP